MIKEFKTGKEIICTDETGSNKFNVKLNDEYSKVNQTIINDIDENINKDKHMLRRKNLQEIN